MLPCVGPNLEFCVAYMGVLRCSNPADVLTFKSSVMSNSVGSDAGRVCALGDKAWLSRGKILTNHGVLEKCGGLDAELSFSRWTYIVCMLVRRVV